MAIEEEFEIARGAAPSAGMGSRNVRGASRAGRAPWPWALAALALVAIGVVAAPESDAAIGVIDGLEEPRPAWRVTLEVDVPDGDVALYGPLAPSRRVAVVGDVAVVATDDVVAGYALETGEPLWQSDDGRFCTLLDPIACVEDPGIGSARVVRVDTLTGDVEEVAVPYALTAVPAHGGIVAVVSDGSTVAAVRLDLDGTERWRTTLVDGPIMPVDRAIGMTVVGDHVYVPSPPAVLDLATGDEVPDTRSVLAGRDAGFRSGYDSSAVELSDGRVVDLPANATPLAVDDDPRSPLDVVLTDPGLAVVDVTGDPVLELGQERTPLARLDGHLITSQLWFGHLISHDLATDEDVARREGWAQCPCLGSGSTLVVLGTQNTTLDALDVATLQMLWTVPIGALDTYDAIDLGAHGALVLDDDQLSFLPWGQNP